MIRNFVGAFILVAVAALGPVRPAAAETFAATDYVDVTARKKLPKATKDGPLAAVAQYVAAMPDLDAGQIVVEVLADEEGRRVYRIDLICKSAESCGDDSIAGTREALDIKRGADGWAIVWVGSQTLCHEGRGHQDWSKEPCK